MGSGTEKTSLKKIYLFIALGPALVFLINQALLRYFGAPLDYPSSGAAAFDVHSEAAARYAVLAALMLFFGAALAAVGFFIYTLRMLENWLLPLAAVLALVAVSLVAQEFIAGRESFDYSGKSLACFAARDGPAKEAQGKTGNSATPPQPATAIEIPHIRPGEPCPNRRFERMRWLPIAQFIVTVFSFPALVLGAICCLAAPGGDTATRDKKRAHWEEQSEWLNTYLYLAALLLITALLFSHAYLRWPGHALETRTAYDNHMAALVSYYGFTFTVMLASFYIPVATILSGKLGHEAAAPGESRLPNAFAGPVQLLKIVLALFSTAFAGALPDILDSIV